MRLLISAGGTGGGVYPALAVLQALTNLDLPGFEVLWIGGEGGMEADLVTREGIPFMPVPAAGVHGVGWRALPRNINQIRRGYLASRQTLKRFRPHALFFTGGFVGVPVALAARTSRAHRPAVAIYVPDIEPGLALKSVSRFADLITVTAPDSRRFFPASRRVEVTGYPTRPSLRTWSRSEALAALHLSPDMPVLLVSGGSKGARSINQALAAVLSTLLARMQVIHISGSLDWPEVEKVAGALSPDLRSRYFVYPYLHEEMGASLAAADLILTRAGASTLGELPLFGLPAILVPYPYAWRYQKVNADYLVSRGAAALLPDEVLPARLLEEVLGLIFNPARLAAHRAAMSSLAVPDAADRIAAHLVTLASVGSPQEDV